MFKIALGLFFVAHGLVHAGLAAAPNPADQEAKPGTFFTSLDRSWLLPKLGLAETTAQRVGALLVALSTLGFCLAGLGVYGAAGLMEIWRITAIISASISLTLLTIFWHPWLPVGVLINIVTLVTLLFANWPPADMIGS